MVIIRKFLYAIILSAIIIVVLYTPLMIFDAYIHNGHIIVIPLSLFIGFSIAFAGLVRKTLQKSKAGTKSSEETAVEAANNLTDLIKQKSEHTQESYKEMESAEDGLLKEMGLSSWGDLANISVEDLGKVSMNSIDQLQKTRDSFQDKQRDFNSLRESIEELTTNNPSQSKTEATFLKRVEKDGNQYAIYSAQSKNDALSFLRDQTIKEERRFVIVETPEGNFGKDLILVFNEQTGDVLELGDRKPLPEIAKSMTSCARCGYSVIPGGRSRIPGAQQVIIIDEMKKEGQGFYCDECRTIWCAFCIALEKTRATCGICGGTIDIFRE